MSDRFIVRLSLLSFALAVALALPLAAEETATPWGARAAAADSERSIEEMLRYAIQDEYLARAEYLAIMRKHGEIRPFSNIVRSEESHISWLKDAYSAAKLPIPPDTAMAYVVIPDTLKAAFQAGVAAEIDNIAMYDSFLDSPLLGKAENASLKALFIRLRDASKNHLAAFQNGLSKY